MSRNLDSFCAGIQDEFDGFLNKGIAQWSSLRPAKRQRVRQQPRPPIVTKGHLGGAERAYIYVSCARDGLVKVGMSSKPTARCRELGVGLFYAVEVPKEAAKWIETEVLRSVGHGRGDGEWVKRSSLDITKTLDGVLSKFRFKKSLDNAA